MKPQPRETGCVHCARPDQWGASSGHRVGRPYPGSSYRKEGVILKEIFSCYVSDATEASRRLFDKILALLFRQIDPDDLPIIAGEN